MRGHVCNITERLGDDCFSPFLGILLFLLVSHFFALGYLALLASLACDPSHFVRAWAIRAMQPRLCLHNLCLIQQLRLRTLPLPSRQHAHASRNTCRLSQLQLVPRPPVSVTFLSYISLSLTRWLVAAPVVRYKPLAVDAHAKNKERNHSTVVTMSRTGKNKGHSKDPCMTQRTSL